MSKQAKKMYVCEICDEQFNNPQAFGGHKGSHKRKGQKYSAKSILQALKTIKLLMCTACSKVFSSVGPFRGHRKYCGKLKFEDLKKRGTRKEWLIRERGKKCEECGTYEWRGKPAPIQIDHIDGNRNNNEKRNLRLLCAMCHALTDTFAGKNIGRYSRLAHQGRASGSDPGGGRFESFSGI